MGQNIDQMEKWVATATAASYSGLFYAILRRFEKGETAMIINFGSINADLVYQVPHMPRPGETLLALDHAKHLGGKGLNQSVAVARAGGYLRHVGCVGKGDNWINAQISAAGIDKTHILETDTPTGHAIIYVDPDAENEIVIFSGANQCLTMDMVRAALDGLNGADHWVLFQNETNLTADIARYAKDHGFKIAYSAAPFSPELAADLLPLTDLLVVNETEAAELADTCGGTVDEIKVPMLLVTLGAKGCWLRSDNGTLHQDAFAVQAVDTTGAGDTFLGSFLAQFDTHSNAAQALRYAAAASALQVTKHGAANAIPPYQDVIDFLKEHAQ